MTTSELAGQLLVELIRKSGVREWEEATAREAITSAAWEMAANITGEGLIMALPDYARVTPGTAKTLKSAAGDAALTLTSVANGAARQSATLDLGASWAQRWRIDSDMEIAATPTTGTTIDFHASFNGVTGAGKANTSGSDAAYTGYSSNVDASVKQLPLIGVHVCTVQATATVQKANAGIFFPSGRYLNLVVVNRSGAALHSAATNMVVTLTPLDNVIEDT